MENSSWSNISDGSQVKAHFPEQSKDLQIEREGNAYYKKCMDVFKEIQESQLGVPSFDFSVAQTHTLTLRKQISGTVEHLDKKI